jgi:hypothetical protein
MSDHNYTVPIVLLSYSALSVFALVMIGAW